ncbi:MAG: hypothetical protein HUU37_08105 [Bdellovibrionales bacterium]|nr:hypothetical protein [Bdellovibrionales bacterium]
MRHWADKLYRRTGGGTYPTASPALSVLAVVVLIAAFLVPAILKEHGELADVHPSVPMGDRSWRVVYPRQGGNDPVTEADCPISPLCLARPENPLLWMSHFRRSGDDLGYHFGRLRDLESEHYWLGLRIPPEKLKEALRLDATRFLVGYFFSSFDVYVDGKLWDRFDQKLIRRPLMLEFSRERLAAAREISVAIRVKRNPGESFPDDFHSVRTGFATERESAFWARSSVFAYQSKPFFLVGFSLSLSLFFLLLWLFNRDRREYGAMAAFNLLEVLRQGLEMSFVWSQLPGLAWYQVNFVAVSYQAVFGLVLAFSIARFRSGPQAVVLPLALLIPVPVALTASTGLGLWSHAVFTERYVVPGTYLLGAFLCGAQWWALRAEEKQAVLMDRFRRFKLGAFSAGFAVLGAFQFFASRELDELTSTLPYTFRMATLLVTVIMSAFVMADIRRSQHLIKKIPISPFHRRNRLPDEVRCVLLSLDLKGSEELFRLGARLGVGGDLVHACVEGMMRVLHARGFEIVSTEGDSIVAFLETQEPAAGVRRAAHVLPELEAELLSLAADYGSRHGLNAGIHFRSALGYGAIRPVWVKIGGVDRPEWTEAGSGNLFVEIARMLEGERAVAPPGVSTLVLPEAYSAFSRDEESLELVQRSMEVRDKNHQTHRVGLVVVRPAGQTTAWQEAG